MNIHLIAVGNKMPSWVKQGYEEYAQRMGSDFRLILHEIQPEKRTKNIDVATIKKREGERIINAIPKGAQVVALEVTGKQWSTEDLAGRLTDWMASGDNIALIVGGPDGLSPECLNMAGSKWSLSRLTMPHPLVRIVLAEQLYRAWSITRNHPYHRA